MENAKQQAIERLKSANNVLVTVSSNPTVDQLAAAIGLTLFLTKLDKHSTAVFSGAVPSTIEFLKPEKTLEKTTDSLRDFIISLDKSKADKLRYKVEDEHVKVFITPYRTSISEKDLEFSQGDLNVDVVVALGVKEQKDLDKAITSHGRILHDATIIAVSTGAASTLGTVNWTNDQASSYCEMAAELSDQLKGGAMDNQIATAYLTGIVAETARFSNNKTSSSTMTVSAKLMAAGANQQLVATELQKSEAPAAIPDGQVKVSSENGTLEIGHNENPKAPFDLPPVAPVADAQDTSVVPEISQVHGAPGGAVDSIVAPEDKPYDYRRIAMTEPPQLGGVLTAGTSPEGLDPQVDPLSGGSHDQPILSHSESVLREQTPTFVPPAAQAPVPAEPAIELPDIAVAPVDGLPPSVPGLLPPEPQPAPEPEPIIEPYSPPQDETTLADLERSVASPHIEEAPTEFVPDSAPASAPEPTPTAAPADMNADGTVDLDEARNAVLQAIGDITEPEAPAQPVAPIDFGVLEVPPAHGEPDLSLPPGLIPDEILPVDAASTSFQNSVAPPPVPPPMMPPTDDVELPGVVPPSQPSQPSANPNNPFGLPPA